MAEAKFAQILISAKDTTKQGFDSAKKNVRDFQGSLGSLGSSFSGVFAAATSVLPALAGVAGVFSGAGIAASVLNTANALDAFNDAADATGASVENLSALEAIALRNGESLDTVQSAIIKLNQALSQDPDGKQAQVLKDIGLSADELRAKDPALALRDVAVAFAAFEGDGDKARDLFQLLGRSAADLAPFLGDVADAGELNATVTAAQAKEAERFNKALSGLGAGVTQVARNIGSELLPDATKLVAKLVELTSTGESGKEGLGRLSEGFKIVSQTVKVLYAEIEFVFTGIGREIGAVAAQFAALSRLDFKGFGVIGDAVKEDARAARLELDAYVKSVLAGTAAEKTAEESAKKKPRKGRVADTKVTKDTSDALQRAAQQMVDDWSPLKLRWDLAANEFDGGANADVAKWAAESEERLEGMVARYRDLIDPAEKYRQELQVVTALETTGRLTAEEAFTVRSRLIEEEERALDGRNEKVKEGSSFAREFGLTMTSAFEDAILSAQSFGEVFKGLSKDIAQIIIRSSITEPLGKAASGFFEELDLGGSIAKFFGGGRATGGPVQAGKLYEVNETGGPGELLTSNGRTFLMANQNGYVTPTRAGAGGGAGGAGGSTVNVYQTMTFQGGADRATLSAWAAQVQASTEQSVLASLNRNGQFARAVGRAA